MVKPPRIRHSKMRKDPVTIDLDPADVKRAADEKAAAANDAPAAAEAEPFVKPNAADEALADDGAIPPAGEEQDKEAARNAATGDSDVRYGRTAAEPRPAPAGRGGMPALAAGVAGALIALAGAAALQWAGALPAPRSESAAIDSASLDVLRSDIETLKQQLSGGEAAGPALARSVAESDERVGAVAAALDQLRADMATLQESATVAPGDPAALQSFETRLAALEGAEGAAGENTSALAETNRQLAELRSTVEEVAAQAGRIDALELRVGEIASNVETQAAEPGMAMAVAAMALKSAIDRGAPFMMELETYAAIAPDVPQITALRDMAASGVPSRVEIEAETADAAGRMIAAASAPAGADAGFLERMFTSAQSLVEIRPVGTVEGDSPGAIVARMEVALNQGDYEEAVAEFETLPEPARTAGQEFIAKVQARAAADRLVAEALAGGLKTPGGEG